MDLGEPLVLPSIDLPEVLQLPVPVLDVPRAKLPYYKPLVVPPNDLSLLQESRIYTKESTKNHLLNPQHLPSSKTSKFRSRISVPMPTNEIMVAAGTTAVISVAATLQQPVFSNG